MRGECPRIWRCALTGFVRESSRVPAMPATASIHADAAERPTTQVTGEHVCELENDLRPHDARSLQAALERSLHDGPAGSEAVDAPDGATAARPAAGGGTATRRVLKMALGLGLAATVGWSPLRAMLATTSVEALVNARVETIRSPIEGIVESAPERGRDWGAAAPRRVCGSSTRWPIMRGSTICGVSIRRSNPRRAARIANRN